MTSSLANSSRGRVAAASIAVAGDVLVVQLVDGRSVSVPISWFPRLLAATPAQRQNFRLIGEGEGVHWPDLDEDLSVEALLR